MATNVILQTPSLPKSPIISFSHDLCHKPVSASYSVSSLEDYPFRCDSSLLGSTSDFDRTSEISSLLTSPRISFSHEDYQSDSLLLGFGSDIDLNSENPSSPTSPRISFSHDLCHEDRSVPSLEDYQSDSLLLGFGSDIDLVSENSVFASRRSSDSLNTYSDYYSCTSDFDLISETVGFSATASPTTWVSHCICCSDSDSGFDFWIDNDTTAKQHCSLANELFSDGRIQEKAPASSELIPLSGADRQKNQSLEFLRHHNKRSLLSSLPVLLRSYSTGSLLGCKTFAEFNF